MSEPARIDGTSPEALRDALNSSDICPGPVAAACVARQGHSPSMAGMILLYGLVRLFFAPGSRLLPRVLVLVATDERLLAFRARGGVGGEGYRVTVYPGEEGSWARSQVALEAAEPGITMNAVLRVPGEDGPEEVRLTTPNSQLDEAMEALAALLGAPA